LEARSRDEPGRYLRRGVCGSGHIFSGLTEDSLYMPLVPHSTLACSAKSEEISSISIETHTVQKKEKKTKKRLSGSWPEVDRQL